MISVTSTAVAAPAIPPSDPPRAEVATERPVDLGANIGMYSGFMEA